MAVRKIVFHHSTSGGAGGSRRRRDHARAALPCGRHEGRHIRWPGRTRVPFFIQRRAVMISETIASFVTNCSYESLPQDVRELAKHCLLDWMGSAIRGSVEPPALKYAEVARIEGGNPRATALPDYIKTSVSWAAQINAAASHTVE